MCTDLAQPKRGYRSDHWKVTRSIWLIQFQQHVVPKVKGDGGKYGFHRSRHV